MHYVLYYVLGQHTPARSGSRCAQHSSASNGAAAPSAGIGSALGSMLSVDLILPRVGAPDPRVEKMSGRTSQHKQDAWVDSTLKLMRNGFVVESGACAPRSDERLVAPVL